jgi:hypothetical protein
MMMLFTRYCEPLAAKQSGNRALHATPLHNTLRPTMFSTRHCEGDSLKQSRKSLQQSHHKSQLLTIKQSTQ